MENSKRLILENIRKNKPGPSELPAIPEFEKPTQDLQELFSDMLVKVGGRVFTDIKEEQISSQIRQLFPETPQLWSGIPEVMESTVEIAGQPHAFEKLDLTVIRGSFGVGENAAIWVEESVLPHRVIAFITQHLIIVLDKQQLVWNMHQAYSRIGNSLPSFGLFISGPSKTADIEQSLVVGAQGPKSLTVFLV